MIVVLDPDHGDKIEALKRTHRLWFIDSPKNREAWTSVDAAYANSAIFKLDAATSLAHNLIRALSDIEDHLVRTGAGTPYERLRVIGLALNDDLERRLAGEGLSNFRSIPGGVEARRIRR